VAGQLAAQALFGHLPKCDAPPLCLRAAVLQEKRWTRERLQEPTEAFERLVAELEDMKGRPGLLAPHTEEGLPDPPAQLGLMAAATMQVWRAVAVAAGTWRHLMGFSKPMGEEQPPALDVKRQVRRLRFSHVGSD
jgi:hypothetical protein